MLPPAATPPAPDVTLPPANPLTSHATIPSAPMPNAPMATKRSIGARSAAGTEDTRSMIGRTSTTTTPMAIPPKPATFPNDASGERSIACSLLARSIPDGRLALPHNYHTRPSISSWRRFSHELPQGPPPPSVLPRVRRINAYYVKYFEVPAQLIF